MKEYSRYTTSAALRRWRRTAIVLAVTTTCSLALLAVTAFFATQTLSTHYNLYYLLWKVGLRSYEQPVALAGLFHDHGYRHQLIGMTVAEFERTFPNTFYEVRKLPPIAKPNQVFYIDDYQSAQREDGLYGMCWKAVFEDGRLIEFEFFKT